MRVVYELYGAYNSYTTRIQRVVYELYTSCIRVVYELYATRTPYNVLYTSCIRVVYELHTTRIQLVQSRGPHRGGEGEGSSDLPGSP